MTESRASRRDAPRSAYGLHVRASHAEIVRHLKGTMTPTALLAINPALTSFAELGVHPALVDALAAAGATHPFAIQAATLPDALAGRDVLGRARTGSGKTIAFAIPAVCRLVDDARPLRRTHPQALILAPTRELATQILTAIEPLAAAAGLRATSVFGGVPQVKQVRALQRGVDILVACPGRLEDLMRQRAVSLEDVSIVVLDEADHMADLGFLPAVKRILDATPKQSQRLLFSATLDNGIDVLVRRYLKDPTHHSVDSDATTEPDIDHHVLTVSTADKPAIVRELASGRGRTVMFMRTKHGARKLAQQLTSSGIPAVDLHGNLAQAARDRNLSAFRDGRVRVLVATDIAARGIHVDDIGLVVHVDPPAEHKAYTHRSGRTARAGASGVVVTLQTPAQERDVSLLTRKAGVQPSRATVSPGSKALLTLTGPRAELVHLPAEPAAVQVRDPKPARHPKPARRAKSAIRTNPPRRSQGGARRSTGSSAS